MRFLAPWPAAAIGLAALAVVLVLHALRLRRGFQRVSSTLLWSVARRDLEGNVPWQRIRPSTLLFLRLVAVALLALAIARPVVGGAGRGRVIVLLDASASMAAPRASGEGTRLDEARRAASAFVERMLADAPGTEIAVGTLASEAALRTGFERSAPALRSAIDAVEPTDEADDPSAVRVLADALRGADDRGAEAPQIVLFSDRSAIAFEDAEGRVTLVDVDERTVDAANVGVTALGVRRESDDPARIVGLARIARSARGPSRVLVEAAVDDDPVMSREVVLPEAATEIEIGFAGTAASESLVRVRIHAGDDLPADDEAVVVLAPRRAPRVLVVAPDAKPDPWIDAVLDDAGAEVETASRLEVATAVPFDLVVFDRVSPERWPPAPSLVMGGLGPGLARADGDPGSARRIASWRRTDPLLRHAVLDDVAFDGAAAIAEDDDVDVLARDSAGRAVIVAHDDRGVRHLVVGFSLARSTWPAGVSFPIVMRNVLDAASVGRLGREARATPAGVPIDVQLDEGGRARIAGPEVRLVEGAPGARATVVLHRAGVYEIEGAVGMRRLALGVLSIAETAPGPSNAGTGGSALLEATSVPRPVEVPAHRWVLAAVFAVALVEWLGYTAAAVR